MRKKYSGKHLDYFKKNKSVLSYIFTASFLLFLVLNSYNKEDPHKAEIRFSENSSLGNIIGSVVPASCDSSPYVENYGHSDHIGCSCANGAPDFPSCTSIAGNCGSADGGIFFPDTDPVSSTTVSRCSSGGLSGYSGSGPWSWSCAGYYGGGTSNCSAQKLNASCSSTTGKKYTQDEFDLKVLNGTICSEGTYGTSSRTLLGNLKAWICKDVARDISYDNCSYELVAPAVQVQVQGTP